MTICEAQVRSRYLGVKRTWLVVLHMCAFDPKRTLQLPRACQRLEQEPTFASAVLRAARSEKESRVNPEGLAVSAARVSAITLALQPESQQENHRDRTHGDH
jgi:hypothetical protein